MTTKISEHHIAPKYSDNIYFTYGMLMEISLQNLSNAFINHNWFNKTMFDLTGCTLIPEDWMPIEDESRKFGQVYEAIHSGRKFAKDLPKLLT